MRVWARTREASVVSRLVRRVGDVAAVLGRVVGAPDYERYLAHLRARHPAVEPLTPEEFYCTRLEDRYSKPGAKCC